MRIRKRDESGFALATVMIATMVLSMLALATVDYAVGSQNISHHDQNWNGALAAAEAGIDDYIFRLSENGNYWQYNADEPAARRQPGLHHSTCRCRAAQPTSKFRYDVDASTIAHERHREAHLDREGSATRPAPCRATLRRRSFLDYLYFTDFETVDPALYTGLAVHAGAGPDPLRAPLLRRLRQPARRAEPHRLHRRQRLERRVLQRHHLRRRRQAQRADAHERRVHGVRHAAVPRRHVDELDRRRAASSTATTARRATRCSRTRAARRYSAPLTMPPTNSAIKARHDRRHRRLPLHRPDADQAATSNGTMTVKSPFSKQTNNAALPEERQTGALPTNGVIYVQNVPSTLVGPELHERLPVQRQRPRAPARHADRERPHHLRLPQRRRVHRGHAARVSSRSRPRTTSTSPGTCTTTAASTAPTCSA